MPCGLREPAPPLSPQDEELLGHVQRAILQVQGDCEKLNITTSNLIADHQQKQKDITVSRRQGGGRLGVRRGPGRPACPSGPRSLLSAPCPQALYQGLQKLEREKANREHLEMEIDVVRRGQARRGRGVPGAPRWAFLERPGVEGSPQGWGADVGSASG